jgi:hypothetical protein
VYQNIPLELRQRNQWVVWKAVILENGRITKIPFNPVTGGHAMSTEPATWTTFDNACQICANQSYDGIGFMLAAFDDFVFIDLDNPDALNADGTPKFTEEQKPAIRALQVQVAEAFRGSYAEISPSGTGLHIIAKGRLPDTGKRRNAIEIYDRERFMTMTGRIYDGSAPAHMQPQIDWLLTQLGGNTQAVEQPLFQGDLYDTYTDQEIIDKATNAQNGGKFLDLAHGNWQQYYSSQSEADFAFIDILAFYTQSKYQIARIFRLSQLGKRDKADRDNYVFPMIGRAFDRLPSPVDMDAMRAAIDKQFAREIAGVGAVLASGASTQGFPNTEPPSGTGPLNEPLRPYVDIDNPYLSPVPGLVGQIAYYIYNQAPRPVPEIALAGAIGLMAGICGRAFNVSRTGLNQYIMLLAPTGRGKEAINSGISKLMHRVSSIDPGGGGTPAALEFIGPSEISSGQALGKHLSNVSKSFVSIIGEFDLTLKNLSSRHANQAQTRFKQVLLSSYGASGRGEQLGSTIYSDKDKNAGAIASPAFSLIGEGTPDRFYNLLDETLVSDGLLPRFTIIEYEGERVPLNLDRANVEPSNSLVVELAKLCGFALMLNQRNQPIDVQFTPEAQAMMHGFDRTVDGIMNKAGNEVVNQLWNRAYLKAAKLAALIAIGVDWTKPTITTEMAEYAIAIVKHDTTKLVARFARGDVGEGDGKQIADMIRMIKKFFSISQAVAKDSYNVNAACWADHVFNQTYLARACANLSSFRNDRLGATAAIKRTTQHLVDTGVITKVGAPSDLMKYGLSATGAAHYVANAGLLQSA